MAPFDALGVITINIDPVFRIGPFTVHWYGVFYAVAFFCAYWFGALPLAERKGVSRALAEKITVWTIVFGLLGARLYYDVQQPDFFHNYLLNPINLIAFWNGGMAFFGAIIGGLTTLAVCAWRYRLNPWMVLDGGALFAVVGQPIGRIGNLINGDILGDRSTLPWAVGYSFQTSPDHCAILQTNFNCVSDPGGPFYYQPAMVYEALGTIVIGILLYLLYRRHVRDGVLVMTYVALYAISQLILFVFRKSEPAGPLGLREAQWTAIAVLVIAVPGLYVVWRRTATRLEAMHTRAHAPPTAPATAR
ncbi:MAG: prolipoprotein diacylglyceryl transferase [Candidatus Dormibacteraeota bacterium]|nr:prolipoprotein diacylglyceryl transferase [Candidatus Dormibacteraeota bacterium]